MRRKLAAIGLSLALSCSSMTQGMAFGDTLDDIGDEISRDSALERTTLVILIALPILILSYWWLTSDPAPDHSPAPSTPSSDDVSTINEEKD